MSGISVWNHGMERVGSLMYRWNMAVSSLLFSDDIDADMKMILDLDATQKLSTLLSRLDLDPDFRTLTRLMLNTTDVTVINTQLWQYAGQTYQKSAQSALMTIPAAAQATYANLTAIKLTNLAPGANDTAYFYATKYRHQILAEAYQGSLWLYPVAGGVLVLCALRSLIRYHFAGRAQGIIHGIFVGMAPLPSDAQIWGTVPVALELDDPEIDDLMRPHNLKPVFRLVEADWGVAVVFLAYLLTTLLTSVSSAVSRLTSGGPVLVGLADTEEAGQGEVKGCGLVHA
jgi:hypothetical protein